MILVGRLHSQLVALHEELQREVEMMESSNEMLVGLHMDLKLRNYAICHSGGSMRGPERCFPLPLSFLCAQLESQLTKIGVLCIGAGAGAGVKCC